jgi:glycosyltransferase involved in cell wall biosynthesis
MLNERWRVSVIMPAYNAAASIADAIHSLLRQEHANWELIVVDDGSSDQTAAVAASFADRRVRLLKRPHRGVSAARNAGLEAMSGDAFAFLDADDTLTPTSLSSRLPILDSRPEVEFVDGHVLFMDAALEHEHARYRPSFRGRPLTKLIELSGECFAGPYWLVRRRPERSYRLKEGMTHCEELLFYVTLASTRDGDYDYTDDVVA